MKASQSKSAGAGGRVAAVAVVAAPMLAANVALFRRFGTTKPVPHAADLPGIRSAVYRDVISHSTGKPTVYLFVNDKVNQVVSWSFRLAPLKDVVRPSRNLQHGSGATAT